MKQIHEIKLYMLSHSFRSGGGGGGGEVEGGGRGIPENGFNGEGHVTIKELNCPTVTDTISTREKRNSFNSTTSVSIFLFLPFFLRVGRLWGRHHMKIKL